MKDPITEDLYKAIRYYKTAQYEKALLICNNIIQIDPTNARAYHGRGLIRVKQREYKKALEDYEKSCRLNPENAKLHADMGELHANMGELYYTLQNFEEAGSHYRNAIQQNKEYESIYQQKTQELLNTASLYEYWDLEKAFSICQQNLLFNPDNDEVCSLHLRLQMKIEKRRNLPAPPPPRQIHLATCRCHQCMNY